MKELPLGGIAEQYIDASQKAARFFAGDALREAVRAISGCLPAGPLLLLSTSDAGAGIAAACAFAREDGDTIWRKVDLTGPPMSVDRWECVFVEAVEPEVSWRAAVTRRYPGARIVSADNCERAAAWERAAV